MADIEKIMQPTLFRSSYHKASANLVYTSWWLVEAQEKMISEYGLTWEDFAILSLLRAQYPYAMNQNQMQLKLPYIYSRIRSRTGNLIKRELMENNRHDPDKSIRGYRINRGGLDMLTQIDKKIRDFDKIIGTLSPVEADELSTLLDKARS